MPEEARRPRSSPGRRSTAWGVGKTRAALEYAWRYAEDYTALLFVSALSAGELRSRLADLVGVLAIDTTETAVEPRLAEVLRWLDAHPAWLLILDNVDTAEAAAEAERLLARLRAGHVLITSRISNWGAGVEPLELHVLAEADAVAFLLERTRNRRRKPDDPAVAAAIARELDGLALALEQAGAYIDKLQLSFAEYLRRWQERRAEVLRWHDERLMGYPASVAVTWETTFAQLTEPERRLLGDPGLAGARADPPDAVRVRAADGGGGRGARRAGGAGGLLAGPVRGRGGHRLGSSAGAGDHPRPHRRGRPHRHAAGRPGRRECPGRGRSVGCPHLGRVDAPGAARGGGHPIRRRRRAGRADGAVDECQLGLYWQARGQFRAAEPLFRRALAIDEQSYGPDHPDVAIDLNNLAGCCRPPTARARPSR